MMLSVAVLVGARVDRLFQVWDLGLKYRSLKNVKKSKKRFDRIYKGDINATE